VTRELDDLRVPAASGAGDAEAAAMAEADFDDEIAPPMPSSPPPDAVPQSPCSSPYRR
jgi:hypothetical protein